jgi:hypothetical protein
MPAKVLTNSAKVLTNVFKGVIKDYILGPLHTPTRRVPEGVKYSFMTFWGWPF